MIDTIAENTPRLDFQGGLPEIYEEISLDADQRVNWHDLHRILTIVAQSQNPLTRLDQLVRFGDMKPQPLSAFCIDLNNPDDARNLFNEIIKTTATDGHGGLSKRFIAPRFIIMPPVYKYNQSGIVDEGSVSFKVSRLGNDDAPVLFPVLKGNSRIYDKGMKGNLVIATHSFVLQEMNDCEIGGSHYILKIESPYTQQGLVTKKECALKRTMHY